MKDIHSGLAMGLMVSMLLPMPVALAQEPAPSTRGHG